MAKVHQGLEPKGRYRASAIGVYCIGSDDGVIGCATLSDVAGFVVGIVKHNRAVPVKPHNADNIDRLVCRVTMRATRS